METYPYMIANNKISGIFESIRAAAKPNKFNVDLLNKMGFRSSNDRAIIPLLKRLGFINEENTPTAYYDDLRDPTQYKYTLADRIRNLYKELFQIKTNIQTATDAEIKGAFSRITGKDETAVTRFFNTFKALASLADFTSPKGTGHTIPEVEKEKDAPKDELKKNDVTTDNDKSNINMKSLPQFHYNIQIHLPATTDVSVYNAIFKSIKENLINE